MNIRPFWPADQLKVRRWNDRAKDGYSIDQLVRLVRDCEEQPSAWRERANLAHAYYDGKQLTEDQRAMLAAEDLEPRVINLIGRVINTVLGAEAKGRSDPRIEADDESLCDVVDVLNVAFKEAQRETYAEMAVSSGYGGQVKGGIGWVEVGRDPDPLNYPYRVREVHRNEMWWDWRSRDFLLRDARWMVRSQWHDLDELEATMPEHRDILRLLANNWEGWAANMLVDDLENTSTVSRAFDEFRRFNVKSFEWWDAYRKRVRLFEVWYKVPATAVVMRLGPRRVMLFDEKDRLHQIAVQRGLAKLEKVTTRQVRMSIFAGPYRLIDKGTNRRNFPYVPFFAFRDDEDASPYGLIEGMIGPQDEYNERRNRLRWLLKARQVLVDNDALDPSYNDFEDLAEAVQRPDMLLVRNAARRNANGVEILSNISLQKEQYEAMQDARTLIQDVPGVYPAQMGQGAAGVTSGVAISGLVEQGAIAMGDLNDNYKMSRRLVYENLLDLIVEDHAQADLQAEVGQGDSRRVVVLNTFDERGLPKNMVRDAPTRVGMPDTPATPAARAQQQLLIGQMMSSLAGNPQAAAALMPAFLESSALDSETRRQAVEDFRRTAGLPAGGDRAARQQAEQQQAEQAQQQASLNDAMSKAKVAEVQGKAQRQAAGAERELAEAEEIRVRTKLLEQQQSIDDALNEADQTQGAPA